MTRLTTKQHILWIPIICVLECFVTSDVSALTHNKHTNQLLHPGNGFDNVDKNPSIEVLPGNYNIIAEDANDDSERIPNTEAFASDHNAVKKAGNSDYIYTTADENNNNNFVMVINDNPTENVINEPPVEYSTRHVNKKDIDLNKKHKNFRNKVDSNRNVFNNPSVKIYPIPYTINNLNHKYITPSNAEEIKNNDVNIPKWDHTNMSTIYLAGYDDQIFKLMYDIQKQGAGTELLIYFYIHKNNKYCNIGYFYTNKNVLRNCISNYSHYFCLDNNSGSSCLESLGIFKPNEISNIQMIQQTNKKITKTNLINNTDTIQTKEANIEPIFIVCNKSETTTSGPKEYYPVKQSSDAYEFILPKENDINSKDIYIDFQKNKNPKADKNLISENDDLNIKVDNVKNLSGAAKSDSKPNLQVTHYLSETPNEIISIDNSTETANESCYLEDGFNITNNKVTDETPGQNINDRQTVIEFTPNVDLCVRKDPKLQVEPSSCKGQEYNNILVANEDIYNNPQDNTISLGQDSTIAPQNIMLNNTDLYLSNAIENLNIQSKIPENSLEMLNMKNNTVDDIKDNNIIMNVDDEPHIFNIDNVNDMTSTTATYTDIPNAEKVAKVFASKAPIIPDIRPIIQEPINFEVKESLDNAYVETTPVYIDLSQTDKIKPWKPETTLGSSPFSNAKCILPKDLSVPKIDSNAEEVPQNYVTNQSYANMNYQLYNKNQYVHNYSQNQPMLGYISIVNRNKKINVAAYWPLNILQKTLKGICGHNIFNGNVHDLNMDRQSFIQKAKSQTTLGSTKYPITPNSLKAQSNNENIVKYLEPTANQNFKNLARLPSTYHTALGNQIVNAYFIPDSCIYKNILTLENNLNPKITTNDSPISNESIDEEDLVRNSKYFSIKVNDSIKQIVNGLPISNIYDVYLTNLHPSSESLLKHIPLNKFLLKRPSIDYPTLLNCKQLTKNSFIQNYLRKLQLKSKPSSVQKGDLNLNEISNIQEPYEISNMSPKINEEGILNPGQQDSTQKLEDQPEIIGFYDSLKLPSPSSFPDDVTLMKFPLKYDFVPIQYNKDVLGAAKSQENDAYLNKNKTLTSKLTVASKPFYSSYTMLDASPPTYQSTSLPSHLRTHFHLSPPILNAAEFDYDQSPYLPLASRPAIHQHPSLPQTSLYYPFHSASAIPFIMSSNQKPAENVPLALGKIGENPNIKELLQSYTLDNYDVHQANTQPITKVSDFDTTLLVKPHVNPFLRFSSIYLLPSTEKSPFENTIPNGQTILKPKYAKDILTGSTPTLHLSIPQQEYNFMQFNNVSSSSLINNINSYSPIFSSQKQEHPQTFNDLTYSEQDFKYTNVPLPPHSESLTPIPSLSVPSCYISTTLQTTPFTAQSHLSTNEPFNKFNKQPNLNFVSPVSFASVLSTSSPSTKSNNTLAFAHLPIYPYLPYATQANCKSNSIKRPQSIYSTLFDSHISTTAKSSTELPSYPFSSNSMNVDDNLSSIIPHPRSTISVDSNTILTEPKTVTNEIPLNEKQIHPYNFISSNFPLLSSSSGLILSSSLPENTLNPTELNPSPTIISTAEPSTPTTRNTIPSYPYFPKTSTKQPQFPKKIATLPLPYSYTPCISFPSNEVARIFPWKLRTQTTSERINNVDLYGSPPKAYFLNNGNNFRLPSQVTSTESLKYGFPRQGPCDKLSPVHQNINFINVPLSLQSNNPENSNMDLSSSTIVVTNKIKSSNIQGPSPLASNLFLVIPEERATLMPNWMSPYNKNVSQNKNTFVPERVKNPFMFPNPELYKTSDFCKLYSARNLHKYTSNSQPVSQNNLQNIILERPFSHLTPSKLPVSSNVLLPYNLGSSSNTISPSNFNSRASPSVVPCSKQMSMWPLSPYNSVLSNSSNKQLITPSSSPNLLNILTPNSQSIFYSPELDTMASLSRTVTNPILTPSTISSTSPFVPTISNIIQHPHSLRTDSTVYDYSLKMPSHTKMKPGCNHPVLKIKPQVEQTIKYAVDSSNPYIPNEYIDKTNVDFPTQEYKNQFDLHHKPCYSDLRSNLGDKSKTTYFSPYSVTDSLPPLPSSAHSQFGLLSWQSLMPRIQKSQIPFTMDRDPTKLFPYPSIPHTRISMLDDKIPSPTQCVSLKYKPNLALMPNPETSLVSPCVAPFISQTNIPSHETIFSTQSRRKSDDNLNSLLFTSRYLPLTYGIHSIVKDFPKIYPNSLTNKPVYYKRTKPLKYGYFNKNKEIISPIHETDSNLLHFETTSNVKDTSMSEDNNKAINEINNNINKYIRQTLLPNILNEKAVTMPLQNICIAKCNPNDKVFFIKTENPDIELKAWPTEIELVKAKIVFECEKLEALNFCPMVKVENPQYSKEVVQSIVENYVRKYYGEPLIVKSCYRKPYEFVGDINESYIKNNKVYIVWSNLFDC